MKIKYLSYLFILFFFVSKNYAQDSLRVETEIVEEEEIEVKDDAYDPLAPSRAAFYSAVLPGLGQAYNNNYWKIPIIYAGIGTGIYFYVSNDRQYHRYRKAYKRRIAGYDDEFTNEDGDVIISTDGLVDAQRMYSRNKEISILVTLGFYVLNIVDANVDAHLGQFNISEDLSLRPTHQFDANTGRIATGVSLNFNF